MKQFLLAFQGLSRDRESGKKVKVQNSSFLHTFNLFKYFVLIKVVALVSSLEVFDVVLLARLANTVPEVKMFEALLLLVEFIQSQVNK